MARMVAAKASLMVRKDALGEDEEPDAELGIEVRAKLEQRLKSLEEGYVSTSVSGFCVIKSRLSALCDEDYPRSFSRYL